MSKKWIVVMKWPIASLQLPSCLLFLHAMQSILPPAQFISCPIVHCYCWLLSLWCSVLLRRLLCPPINSYSIAGKKQNKTMGRCAQRERGGKSLGPSFWPTQGIEENKSSRMDGWAIGRLERIQKLAGNVHSPKAAHLIREQHTIQPPHPSPFKQFAPNLFFSSSPSSASPSLSRKSHSATFSNFFSSNSFSINFLLMTRQIVLTVPFLFLLLSTCPKPSSVNGIDANKKEENVDDGPRRERIARQSSAGGPSSNKEFNGGIYWLAADGPDFQMWPAMGTAGYGSGGQQQQMANLGAMSQSNGQQQQASGQQQSANAGGQQPSSSMSGIQQQAIVAQQQQQMFPQIQQQGFPQSAFAGYGQMSGGQQQQSAYAGYLEKQISSYPVMIYTLADCIPCQRAKHLLAVHYPDVRAHYLELSGNEPWQQQLQIDLQYLTGAMTFPYIFVCGQYIGGSTELFELHESGQLRRLVSQCLQKPPPK